MNARELIEFLRDDDHEVVQVIGESGVETILRALRLLAAAEANDGTTPETDALIKSQGLTLTPYEAAHYELAENCQMTERERNGLAARVGELEDKLNCTEMDRDHARLDAARSKP